MAVPSALLGAMTAAIRETEAANGEVRVVSGSMTIKDDDEEDVVDYEEDEAPVAEVPGEAAFGIVYQKYEAAAAETPDFEGEAELKRDLEAGAYAPHRVRSLATMAQASDDDEFDGVATSAEVTADLETVLEEEDEEAVVIVPSIRAEEDAPIGDDFPCVPVVAVSEAELVVAKEDPPMSTEISTAEVVEWFRSRISIPPPKKANLFSALRGGAMNAGLSTDMELAKAIASANYDPSEETHYNMLRTCYKALVQQADCRKVGAHWELIGFQGSDPRTDVNRSVRCFALLQLLALIETDNALARELFDLANATGRDWPLACTSIAFSKDVLDDLRAGRLNKACNAANAVFPVLHAHHRAKFVDFRARLRAGEDRFEAINRCRGKLSNKKVSPTTKKSRAREPPVVFDGIDKAAREKTEEAPRRRTDHRLRKYAAAS